MLPLEGLRCIDLSRLQPGPVATHLLADMGMEVIKVEECEPRAGMPRDILSPFMPGNEAEIHHAAYNAMARGKKSIALNLKSEEGKAILYKLVKGADVVVEGYRPGVMKRLGADYATLKHINPRIVYCSLTGYGQDGPYANLPGHDMNYCSVAGQLSLSSDLDGTPSDNGFPMADIAGSVHAVMGIQAALIAREQTGFGQYIDISLAHSVMTWLVWSASAYFRDGAKYVLGEPGRDPGLGTLKCKDGKYVTTANGEAHFWANFCNAIGHPEYVELHRPTDDRKQDYKLMVLTIQELFLTKDRDEWFRILSEADTCVAPVLDIGEAMADPAALHRGMVIEPEHPTKGPIKQIGSAIKFSDTPFEFRGFAPVLGQHTREILLEAAYNEHEIADLADKGVIRIWDGPPQPGLED